MSTETVKLIQGDAGPSIYMTLKDRNTGDPSDPDSWDKLDLSEASTTIHVNVRVKGTTTIVDNAVCSKVGPTMPGQIIYVPSTTIMLSELALFEVEIYVDFNGAIQTIHELLNMRLTEQF